MSYIRKRFLPFHAEGFILGDGAAYVKKRKRITPWGDIRRNYGSYILALPAFIYVFIFSYCTLPYMFTAFQKFSYKTGLFNSEFVGFKNFEAFILSSRSRQVTWNTLKLNFLFILFVTIISIFFAIILYEISGKLFKKINQSVFIFPHFLSWVIVSYVVYGLFASELGLVNKVLEAFGVGPYVWYNMPKPWTWIMVACASGRASA
jgi:putative aldouronate transport system permease protein